jgi:TIR domain
MGLVGSPMSAFISYSQQDLEVAQQLSTSLLKHNAKFWRDENKMLVGDKLWVLIEEAIRRSTSFVVLLSPDALRSEWVTKELNLALELESAGHVIIIPVVIAPCTMPASLVDHLAIRITEAGFDDDVERLAARLNRLDAEALPVGRTKLGPKTFSDHGIEIIETADGRFGMNLDVVSFDLEEEYTVVSQFNFIGLQPFSGTRTHKEQTDSLLVSCAASFKAKTFHVPLGSGKVHRETFRLNDGEDVYTMTSRIRRVGSEGRGYVVFNAGALFELVCDSHGIEMDREASN